MKYDAALTNAKPPGEIQSKARSDRGSPASLEIHRSMEPIASTTRTLACFPASPALSTRQDDSKAVSRRSTVRGDATVPDFRLKRAGNPVPLRTSFEALVDGTNGDTVLKPVNGTLGSTSFTTSGGILKHEADIRRTISLDVLMPAGNLRDVLTLAMRGAPFMQGKIFLKTTIDIPPLTGKVREKLLLDGHFEISQGKFLRSTIQDQIDSLSRRGQGQPKNQEIDEVVSVMAGTFTLENEVITFRSLSFAVPGSGVDLAGSYDLGRDVLDFHGTLRLHATVSRRQ